MARACTLIITLSFYYLSLVNAEDSTSFITCLTESSILNCASSHINVELDRLQNVTGKQSDVPISKVIEQTRLLVTNGFDAVFGNSITDGQDEDRGIGDGYKLHFHKQKKKLRKLFVIGMVLKSKISLLFQLMSAHFQIKFFAIAVLGLIINAIRLWFDIKRMFQPNKVVYYEHAQHQHHYEHDDHDDHGYWARSSNQAAGHNLAYSGHVPKH